MEIKIGVISDLHCHSLEKNKGKRDSYLLSDEELPVFQDPYKSLEYLINNGKKLDVDILIMPGDFTNMACPEGLLKGFEIVENLKKIMNSKVLISSVGNHDLDSHNTYSKEPLKKFQEISKKFPNNFPLNNESFWNKGYEIIEFDYLRILVINTSHNHFNKKNAEHGDISEDSLKFLEDELSLLNDDKIGIVLTHHSPLEHSHFNSGINDFMHNGDDLTKIIDKYDFKLLIHGHKHDPRIRKLPGGINSPFVFSSGSFSAVQEKLLLGGCNTFHIITLNVDGKYKGKGKIDTWFFSTAKGWSNEIMNQYFEPHVGFGAIVDIDNIAQEILNILKVEKNFMIEWEELEKKIPELGYLMTIDLNKLKDKLSKLNIKTSPFSIGSQIFLQLKN